MKLRAGMALFVGLVSMLSFQGCLRYVPSKEELEKQYAKEDGAQLDIKGAAEFDAYEQALKRRRDSLIAQRAYLLTQPDSASSYKIGTGDVVTLAVYGFDDLRTESEVSSSGTISLPLVGEVSVKGMSVADARSTVAQRYARFIRTPNVDLVLKSYQSARVPVIGEVSKPGVYPLRRTGQLLTELLSEAGGKTERASGRIILLPRQGASQPSVQLASLAPMAANAAAGSGSAPAVSPDPLDGSGIEIDMEDLVGQSGERPLLVPLLPGDTIVVPEAGRYEVDGEVLRPGSFTLASRTSALGAVAAAGGFTYSADVKKVEVIRDIGGGKKAAVTLDLEEVGLRGGKDVRLRNGDVIRVPSEPGRFFRRQVVEALNGVFRGVGVNQSVGGR